MLEDLQARDCTRYMGQDGIKADVSFLEISLARRSYDESQCTLVSQ